MRPTRRNFVALGKTSASACRASSIRGMVVAMPCPTFPAIEPDASNTIMASSLQGDSFCSAAMAAAKLETPPIAKTSTASLRTKCKETTILTSAPPPSGARRRAQGFGDVGKGGLLGVAHLHAAEAEEASFG